MEKEHLEIILENMDSKFALILEGHDTLRHEIRETRTELKNDINLCNFKIDALSQRIETVNKNLGEKIDSVESSLSRRIDSFEKNLGEKIDTVAVDLKAHRNDTEAHQVYRVKEGS